MQITIDTERDDLAGVIRMLDAYAPEQSEPVARRLEITDDAGELIASAKGAVAHSLEEVKPEPPKPAPLVEASGGPSAPATQAGAPLVEPTGGQRITDATMGPPPRMKGAAPEEVEAYVAGVHHTGHVDLAPETRITPTPASLFAEVKPEPPKPAPADTAEQPAPPPPAHASTAGELDSAGMPWDARIHASTKTKIADGTWKRKRGVDAELVKQILAELSGSATPAATCSSSPSPTAAPSAPPPPPPPPVSAELSYTDVLNYVMTSGGKVTPVQLQEACKAEGVESFPSLAKHPDKVASVAARLGMV